MRWAGWASSRPARCGYAGPFASPSSISSSVVRHRLRSVRLEEHSFRRNAGRPPETPQNHRRRATEGCGHGIPPTWKGMAPHFDHQEGDVGLMVIRRVALARHCAPVEVVAWSFRSRTPDETVFLPGNTSRGRGACAFPGWCCRRLRHCSRCVQRCCRSGTTWLGCGRKAYRRSVPSTTFLHDAEQACLHKGGVRRGRPGPVHAPPVSGRRYQPGRAVQGARV